MSDQTLPVYITPAKRPPSPMANLVSNSNEVRAFCDVYIINVRNYFRGLPKLGNLRFQLSNPIMRGHQVGRLPVSALSELAYLKRQGLVPFSHRRVTISPRLGLLHDRRQRHQRGAGIVRLTTDTICRVDRFRIAAGGFSGSFRGLPGTSSKLRELPDNGPFSDHDGALATCGNRVAFYPVSRSSFAHTDDAGRLGHREPLSSGIFRGWFRGLLFTTHSCRVSQRTTEAQL